MVFSPDVSRPANGLSAEGRSNPMDPQHHSASRSRQPDSVQRARIWVFANDREVVVLSAAVAPTIIAQMRGDCPVVIATGIPSFWLSEQDRERVAGDASWDAALRLMGFDLVGISFSDWSEQRVHAVLRRIFPTILLLTPEMME